jgi:branched-chain amino acid transport system ATP-binding protein
MLFLDQIVTYYGNVQALKGVSFDVGKGEMVALIGSNGAGKTTILRTISGLLSPRSGRIRFMDEEISGRPPFEVIKRGIAHSPEGRRVWPDMTVFENLRMGAYLRKEEEAIKEDMERMYELFPILTQRRDQLAGSLSGGEQQMLAIARALMSKPRLLLLDEPSLGLAPIMVERVAETVVRLNRSGMTILLVEQNANLALMISSRAYVLQTGKIILSGKSADLLVNDEVRKVYLGRRTDEERGSTNGR